MQVELTTRQLHLLLAALDAWLMPLSAQEEALARQRWQRLAAVTPITTQEIRDLGAHLRQREEGGDADLSTGTGSAGE